MNKDKENFEFLSAIHLGFLFFILGHICMRIVYRRKMRRKEILHQYFDNSYAFAGYRILLKLPLWLVAGFFITLSIVSLTILILTDNL